MKVMIIKNFQEVGGKRKINIGLDNKVSRMYFSSIGKRNSH